MAKFPREIEDFGNEFVEARIKRHHADYDLGVTCTRPEVLESIDAVENAIKGFKDAPPKDRRAFAAWVTLRNRST